MASPPPDLFSRIRKADTGTAARQTLAEQARKAAEETQLPSPIDLTGITGGLRNLEKELKALFKLQSCILAQQEELFGALDDKSIWLPFSFDVPAASQAVTSAVVDQNITFFYTGYGGVAIAGVSWQEILDGVQGPAHFVPPARADDTSAMQYGTKGRRVYNRVDLVIQNATAGPVTIDGWFRGRFRKGGR